jgi:hypothetical protein
MMKRTMNQRGWLGWAALPILVLSSAIGVSSCKQEVPGGKRQPEQVSASVQFKQSQEQLGKATERLFKEARPISDKAGLATRLKLDPARIRVITTGGASSGTVAFDSGTNCKFGHCTCVGDRDCNDMFSTICASPSTGGTCDTSGGQVVCTSVHRMFALSVTGRTTNATPSNAIQRASVVMTTTRCT